MNKLILNINCLALIICSTLAYAESSVKSPVESSKINLNGEISWSVIRTELEKEALGVIAKITPKLNESTYFLTKDMVGYLGPTIEVRTGGNDSFESMLAKVSGFVMLPLPLDNDGEPDTKGTVNVLPFSVGIESDRDFNVPVALAELGWTPIGPRKLIDPNNLEHSERFGLDPTRAFGLFVQIGYKFNDENDSNTTETATKQGGNTDQSKEKPNEAIARIKAEITYGFNLSSAVQFVPKAIGWYDFRNGETYYKLEALVRISVIKDKYSIDLLYEKGSGTPNFNKGDQFSTGLTLLF